MNERIETRDNLQDGPAACMIPKGMPQDRLIGFLLGFVLTIPGVLAAFFGTRIARPDFPASSETAAKWATYGVLAALALSTLLHPEAWTRLVYAPIPFVLLLSFSFY